MEREVQQLLKSMLKQQQVCFVKINIHRLLSGFPSVVISQCSTCQMLLWLRPKGIKRLGCGVKLTVTTGGNVFCVNSVVFKPMISVWGQILHGFSTLSANHLIVSLVIFW